MFRLGKFTPVIIVAKKVGFVPETLAVAASSADTTRATMFLSATIATLPGEAVAAPAPSPYDDKLRMFGFLARQRSSAAPRSAFITAEQLEQWKPNRLTDVSRRTGRSMTNCTIYHDGIAAKSIPTRQGQFRAGLDAMVQVEAVAAMEIYRPPEAPAAYPAKGRDPCVLLIWFK